MLTPHETVLFFPDTSSLLRVDIVHNKVVMRGMRVTLDPWGLRVDIGLQLLQRLIY